MDLRTAAVRAVVTRPEVSVVRRRPELDSSLLSGGIEPSQPDRAH
jgi:hypothetical protein